MTSDAMETTTPAAAHPPAPQRSEPRLDSPAATTAIELIGVEKEYSSSHGNVQAVEGVDLAIRGGEFFSLLGPSGCGKTTTLRMIAGFEQATRGRILLYGDDVTGVPPNRRDVNLVFQSYALFPHLTVWKNVAFGLERKKLPKDEITRRVGSALELVELVGKEKRRPRELSGGQQQRVALARALVNQPRALLLDEPLGALDLKLRQTMQIELKRIQREVGITFVYVTHDQGEALAMSDRLVVMNGGRIEQLGTPHEVYERPATRFVAGFIGTSNVVTGLVERVDPGADHGMATLATSADERLVVPLREPAAVGSTVVATIRPEKIRVSAVPPDSGCRVRATVREAIYLGTATSFTMTTPRGEELVVHCRAGDDADSTLDRGDEVWLCWQPGHSYQLIDPIAATT